jgi:hypothetical protein
MDFVLEKSQIRRGCRFAIKVSVEKMKTPMWHNITLHSVAQAIVGSCRVRMQGSRAQHFVTLHMELDILHRFDNTMV